MKADFSQNGTTRWQARAGLRIGCVASCPSDSIDASRSERARRIARRLDW